MVTPRASARRPGVKRRCRESPAESNPPRIAPVIPTATFRPRELWRHHPPSRVALGKITGPHRPSTRFQASSTLPCHPTPAPVVLRSPTPVTLNPPTAVILNPQVKDLVPLSEAARFLLAARPPAVIPSGVEGPQPRLPPRFAASTRSVGGHLAPARPARSRSFDTHQVRHLRAGGGSATGWDHRGDP